MKKRKKAIKAAVALMLMCMLCSFSGQDEWIRLLDNDLTQWETYLSYRHKVGYNGQVPQDDEAKPLQPIGYNKSGYDAFSVIDQDGTPVLRISGEIYGCLFTKQEFENYHLRLKVKFGTKKWEPRVNEPMDSGILYHSQGECGVDYWRSWMLAQEFQIMEGGFGDYWSIANSGCHIRMKDPESRNDMGIYDPDGRDTPMGAGGNRSGFVQHSSDYEKPGEWNEVELICFEDKSVHIVNGHAVMALSQSVYGDEHTLKPLIKGRIQLQSEAAEVFYKDIEIRAIREIPHQFKTLFR